MIEFKGKPKKDFKIRAYYRKKALKKAGGEIMDRLFTLTLIILALPFILLGAILAWLDRVMSGER